MALKLVSSEWVDEVTNEVESYKRGYKKMLNEHDKVLRQYRDLRDVKDEEIANLHTEIEALKQDKAKQQQEIKRLRQAVSFYEKRHKMEVLDEEKVQS